MSPLDCSPLDHDLGMWYTVWNTVTFALNSRNFVGHVIIIDDKITSGNIKSFFSDGSGKENKTFATSECRQYITIHLIV